VNMAASDGLGKLSPGSAEGYQALLLASPKRNFAAMPEAHDFAVGILFAATSHPRRFVAATRPS
jgi:hypothetical protein